MKTFHRIAVYSLMTFMLFNCNSKKKYNLDELINEVQEVQNKKNNTSSSDLFKPIPKTIDFNQEKAALGEALYHDKQLSADNTVSCAFCHPIDRGGVDGLPFSIGIKNQMGNINAPTVLNSVYNAAQFWDGRADNLANQAVEPVINPIEMGMKDFNAVIKKLEEVKEYKDSFNKLYSDGITKENIGNAIAEFEKTLITPDSKFDQFLRGDKTALNESEKKGFKHFKNLGCVACHNGINIGGNMFQKFGVMVPYKDKFNHLGRYNVTKNEDDKYVFKVPSLRNIELTAPYFHDGSAPDLKTAVKKMIHHQLGRPVNEENIEEIVLFLKTLTGKRYKFKK